MQIILEIDAPLAEELEKVAPAQSRRRSEFIRMAIRKALMDEQERRTREAYLKDPDEEPEYFAAETWEADGSSRPRNGKPRR